MNEDRFVIRTVKDGKVKVYGKHFVPDTPAPDHFEGMRFAFGRYKTGDEYEPYICLWGTEAEYQAHTVDEHEIYCDENNVLKWHWWRAT